MKFLKFAFFFALTVLFQGLSHAQEWVSYQSQQQVNKLVDTGTELHMATDAGLVVMNKSTLEKSFFNKSNTSLSNNHIQTIAESPDGNTWIGTYDVIIMRFDGTGFQEEIIPEGIDNPITIELYDIEFAPNGDLWLGTSEAVFHRQGQTWTRYDEDDLGPNFFKAWNIEINNDGEVFMASFDVYKFENGAWTNLTETADIHGYLDANLFFNSSGDLFFAGDLDVIGRFNGLEWETYEHGLNGSHVKGFTEDTNGNLYFHSLYDGLFKLEDNTWIEYVDAQTEAFDNNTSLFYIDEQNNRWLNSNIYLSVNTNGNIQSTLITPHTIESNSIKKVHQGNDGQLYFISTFNNKKISTLDSDGNWSFLESPTFLMPFENLTDILVIDNQDIWLASLNGLYHYNGAEWTSIDNVDGVSSLTVDTQGRIYARTNSKIYILENGTVSEYNTDNSSLSDLIISGIGIDQNNDLWIASFDWGGASLIQKVSSDGNTWTSYTDTEYPVIDQPRGDFHFDVNGNIWIPLSGVKALKFDGETWTQGFDGSTSQVANSKVYSIESDAEGKVYFSHQYGVTTLLDGEWENLLIADVPNANTSHGSDIEFDDEGTLWWASSREGVFSYTPESTTSVDSDFETITPFAIYPNPARQYSTLDFTTNKNATVKALIYNNLGQLQSNLDFGQLPAGSFKETIDVAHLPKGFYIVQLQINDTTSTKTLIIQ